jgi:YesN/AraC family two-component response regulator
MGSLSGPPTVLLVEDEVIVSLYLADVIEAAGFIAIEAFNADEAIALLMSRRDIRIVITDVNMPGSMDGLRLAHAVRDRWPPIEIIVISGKSRLNREELPVRGIFLSKPVDEASLSEALKNLLNEDGNRLA